MVSGGSTLQHLSESFECLAVEPLELHLAGEPVAWSRNAVYTVSFFVFWGVAMFSSLLTSLLGRSLAELNGAAIARPAPIRLAEHDWQPD